MSFEPCRLVARRTVIFLHLNQRHRPCRHGAREGIRRISREADPHRRTTSAIREVGYVWQNGNTTRELPSTTTIGQILPTLPLDTKNDDYHFIKADA